MARLTLSYRRSDSEALTGRIFDRLIRHYGRKSVFRDIDNVPVGVDFRTHIQDALQKSDILLAVVGAGWHGPRKGHDRIEEETDQVRIEIETALKSGIPVIPVLVGKTEMPKPADLPESLKALCYRNAIHIDPGQDFDHHVDRLIRETDEILSRKDPRGKYRWLVYAAVAAVPLLLAVVGSLYFLRGGEGDTKVPWLNAAYAEIGQKEFDGPEDNPRIMEYIDMVSPLQGIHDDGPGVDWAPAFVAWSLNQAGIRAPQSMDPLAWMEWGRPVTVPVEGCVAVFAFAQGNHVGFYVGEEGDYVKSLGGNQDDSVKVKRYPKVAVKGYRLPDSSVAASGP